jgi:hypothetical protein
MEEDWQWAVLRMPLLWRCRWCPVDGLLQKSLEAVWQG